MTSILLALVRLSVSLARGSANNDRLLDELADEAGFAVRSRREAFGGH